MNREVSRPCPKVPWSVAVQRCVDPFLFPTSYFVIEFSPYEAMPALPVCCECSQCARSPSFYTVFYRSGSEDGIASIWCSVRPSEGAEVDVDCGWGGERPTHFKIGPERPPACPGFSDLARPRPPPHREGRDGPIIERAHSS